MKINRRPVVRVIGSPLYKGENCQVLGNEYSVQATGIGSFYACNGSDIEYSPAPGADPAWVRLYLNGQVLVALLHQRKIINFHASSFLYNDQGVMILGETGAGKSSLTLAFALRHGGFLTDDLTPVVFNGTIPCIMPLNRKVKLRRDTADKLSIEPTRLTDAEKGTGKKYLNLEPVQMNPHRLHTILKVETGKVNKPRFIKPPAGEKFSLLRSEICLWEILAGMPGTEENYLQQLVMILKKTDLFRVIRPETINIKEFQTAVQDFLADSYKT